MIGVNLQTASGIRRAIKMTQKEIDDYTAKILKEHNFYLSNSQPFVIIEYFDELKIRKRRLAYLNDKLSQIYKESFSLESMWTKMITYVSKVMSPILP